jgi:sugar phosphate isomerase/epimerase
VSRRNFLRRTAAAGVGAALASLHDGRAFAMPSLDAAAAERLGWRLGVQAYTFRMLSFYETVDLCAGMGIRTIEMYPGQHLSPDRPTVKTGASLPADLREEVKAKLAEAGVALACFGVTATSPETLAFAKDMGIEVLTTETKPTDDLDRMCQEVGVKMALHNHPNSWPPDEVLAACEGRSPMIGACADTGHWMRSGINPIEALKKLEGRIISFHFKDLDKLGAGAHDVPWGTGVGDVKGMLTEIHRQGIKAVFSIEYEYNWVNSLPDMAQCVAYFDKIAAELGTQGK